MNKSDGQRHPDRVCTRTTAVSTVDSVACFAAALCLTVLTVSIAAQTFPTPTAVAAAATAVTTATATTATATAVTTATATTATAAAAAPTPTAAPGKATITYLGRGTSQERAIYDQLITEFEQANPNVDVNVVWEGGDALAEFEKLQIMAAAGAGPDVFWVHTYLLADLVALKGLYPLNSLVEQGRFDTAAYFQPTLQEFTRGGQLLALPRETSSLALYYNQDRFEAAGLPAPDKSWTWDTLVNRARKLTKGEGASAQWGLMPPVVHGRDLSLIWQNEGDLLSADRTKSAVLSPRTVETYQWIYNLMYSEKVAPSPAEVPSDAAWNALQKGRVAMLYDNRAASVVLNSASFPYDVAPLPAGRVRASTVVSSAHAIYAGTKHPQEAWLLLKHLSGENAQRLFAKSGLVIPAMRKVATSGVFLSPGVRPAHDEVFLESLTVGRPEPITRHWFDIVRAKNAVLADLWAGKKPVSNALQALDQSINQWLAKP